MKFIKDKGKSLYDMDLLFIVNIIARHKNYAAGQELATEIKQIKRVAYFFADIIPYKG